VPPLWRDATPQSPQTRIRRTNQSAQPSTYARTRPYPEDSEAAKRRQQEAGIAALIALAVSTGSAVPGIPVTAPRRTVPHSSAALNTAAPPSEAILPAKGWQRWWALLATDHLIRNSLYLILSAVVQAALGSAFWIIAARLFEAGAVGTASSLVAATGFISTLALLGMNTAVERFLPTASNRNGLVTAALTLVGAAGSVAALIYLLSTPIIAPRLAFVARSPFLAIGFILLTASAAINLLTDSFFITSRQAGYTALTDGVIGGFTKLASAAVLAGTGAYGLYSASMSGFAVAAIASLALMFKALDWRPSTKDLFQTIKPLLRFSSANYVSGAFYLLPSLVVPLIVLDRLGPAEAAYYFMAFQVASLVTAVAYAVGQTFMAEGSQPDVVLTKLLRRSLGVMMAFVLPATLAMAATARWVLLAFGTKYSQHGTLCLIVLVVATIPLALNNWLGTVLRIFSRLRAIIVNGLVYAVSICGFAWFLAPHGLNDLASAWAIGGLLTAGVAAVPCMTSIRRHQRESGRGRHRRIGRTR
jgi:O-antigen/teichoic acid export membrane protein